MNRHLWLGASHVRGAAALAVVLLVSACGASSNSGSSTKLSPVVFAVVAPFTGPDASFGPFGTAGCAPAVKLINQAGGVLGHQAKCQIVDTRGDPADAVPAARNLVATTPNLAGIVGPTSDEAVAIAPILNAAKVPFFSTTGQAIFNHNTYPYYYRLTPADDVAGYGMALWAHERGYTRAAAVFGNDIGSQGTIPTLVRGFTKLGGTIVINEKLALDQTSYRTEVQRMVAAHPQVIFTEVDPQTATTFFSELKQLHGLLPIIGADPTVDPNWFKSVSAAIGANTLNKLFTAENPSAVSSGPAWQVYSKALMASKATVPDPASYTTSGYAESRYNSVNLMALAMIAAKSVKPSVFHPYLVKLTQPKPGAVKVYTFKQGKDALTSGKQIQFIGLGAPIIFDKWHNAAANLDIDTFSVTGTVVKVGHLSPTQMASVER